MTNNENSVKNGIFGMGEKNEAYARYFVGQSYLNSLISDPEVSVGVGNVTFEPGCRNNWHIHHDGFQLLLVTGGEGWYQEAGKAAPEITSRRRCRHPRWCEALAWRNQRQLVCPHRHYCGDPGMAGTRFG